jgi:hypothetical protein
LNGCNADDDCIPKKCPAVNGENAHDLSHSMDGLCSNDAWALDLKTDYGSSTSETCNGGSSSELPHYCA